MFLVFLLIVVEEKGTHSAEGKLVPVNNVREKFLQDSRTLPQRGYEIQYEERVVGGVLCNVKKQ